jgi:hypothetical protein
MHVGKLVSVVWRLTVATLVDYHHPSTNLELKAYKKVTLNAEQCKA